jgi:pimeloyl-ACP methyl ester carboxylesterase
MRAVEILLSIANLLALVVLASPLSSVAVWMRYWVPVALLIAIAQVLVEGPRWQMAPAYILAGLFFVIWLLQKSLPATSPATQLLANRLIVGLAIGFSTLTLAASIILPLLLPVFRFSTPGGPYAIGTLTYHWVEVARPELFSADPNARRELMVQIWYPAQKDASSPPAPYLQDSGLVTPALARLHNFPDFALTHLKYVTSNAIASAPLAEDEPNFPVLIFVEGLTGYRQMNTFQVEALVSNGYIVVGIDQPGAAALVVFPDGHQIAGLSKAQMDPLTQQSVSPAEPAPLLNGQTVPGGIISYFAQDVSFTLDQLASINIADPNNILTQKLDLQHTGIFGVSYGGIVGAEACLKDPRLKACLVMDVVMTANVVQQGLQQPSLWITRDAGTMRLEREKSGGWTEKDIEQTQTTMRAVYNSLPGAGYFLQVPGMFHIDLTDLSSLSPLFPAVGFSGPIGSERAHAIINAYSLAFFDRHLKGQPAVLLNGPAEQYPDVLIETRRP